MKKYILNNKAIFIYGIIFVFVLWFLASLAFDRNSIIIPSPIDTIKEMGHLLTLKSTYAHIGHSLLRLLIGFGISFVIAFILGSLAGNNPHIYGFLKPLMSVFKTIPTASLVFLFIVLSGAKYAAIYVVILICLPILYEAVVGGIKSVEKDILDASDMDGAGFFKSLIYIKIPLSIPYVLVGISASFALSFKIEIMAEIISGYTGEGLGNAIRVIQNNDPTNMTPIFAISLIAIILMLIMSLGNQIIKKTLSK